MKVKISGRGSGKSYWTLYQVIKKICIKKYKLSYILASKKVKKIIEAYEVNNTESKVENEIYRIAKRTSKKNM